MSDTDTLDKIRGILKGADLHRNREKRDALEAIRSLLGIDEGATGDGVAPAADAPESSGVGDDTAVDLDAMSKADLVVLAEKLGLDKKGNKPDLIARIVEHAGSTSDDESSEEAGGDEASEGAEAEQDDDEQSGDADADDESEPSSEDAEESTPDDAAGEE